LALDDAGARVEELIWWIIFFMGIYKNGQVGVYISKNQNVARFRR
jgi:hypothetical protein